MQLTTREARRVIDKICDDRKDCDHHVRGFVVVDGKRLFPVHCSFGNKDIPEVVVHRFRKSLHLMVEEFSVLASCTMTKEEYVTIIVPRVADK